MCDVSSLMDIVRCPVCLTPLTRPRLLSCGHTVCSKCIVTLAKDLTFSCPECRSTQSVPSTGMAGFPPNLLAMAFVEKLRDKLCKVCMSNKIAQSCDICSQGVCVGCVKQHRKYHEREALLTSLNRATAQTEKVISVADPRPTYAVLLQNVDLMALCLHQFVEHQINRLKESIQSQMATDILSYEAWSSCTRKTVEASKLWCAQESEKLEDPPGEWTNEDIGVSTFKFRDELQDSLRVMPHCEPRFRSDIKMISKWLTSDGEIPRVSDTNHNRIRRGLLLYEYPEKVTFRVNIENISMTEDPVLSSKHYFRGLTWRIETVPKYHGKQLQAFGFFLRCNRDCDLPWYCYAAFKITILSSAVEEKPISSSMEHLFTKSENKFGEANFVSRNVLMNSSRGLVKDDVITLQVNMNIYPPDLNGRLDDEYMDVHVVTEDQLFCHTAGGLFDPAKLQCRIFRVMKEMTLKEFTDILEEYLKCPSTLMRLWPFINNNETIPPVYLDLLKSADETLQILSNSEKQWMVFTETVDTSFGISKLPTFSKDDDVLLFLKRYDPKTNSLSYCGHVYMPISDKIGTFLLPILCQRGGFPPNTPLQLFEVVTANDIQQIKAFDQPLQNRSHVMIIIFQETSFD